MKTRISALIVVLMLVLPGSAHALETNELVAIAAMPLAVAAVSDLTEVPTNDLVTVVSALNRANVPPPQFIEVVRYVPVALVDPREPTFVSYVNTQVDEGVVGDALALSLANRLGSAYEVRDIDVVNPQTVYVVERREFVPTIVTTRLQTYQPPRFDPLALIAMPLAVAAVSNLTDVPANDLISFITALNQAAVPAPQFVEVVRYSPVAFVDTTYEPQFIRFVTTEVDRGISGESLAIAIADRYRTIGVREIDVVHPPRTVFVDQTAFVPQIVHTRVAEVKTHPHGGPPGQLKKQRGVQTGAEIVHGSSHRAPRERIVISRDDDRGRKTERRVSPRTVDQSRGHDRKESHVAKPAHGKPVAQTASRNEGRGNNGGRGKSKGNKGKGKG
jgi:hypothetical protein